MGRGEILRYVPVMPPKIHAMLEKGETSWTRAKAACQKLIQSPAGEEDAAAEEATEALKNAPAKVAKPLNFRSAKSRLGKLQQKDPEQLYELSGDDLMSLGRGPRGKKVHRR